MERDAEPRIFFAHRLLRARDWQHRPELDQVCDWWRGGRGGVCALVGIGGAGKTAIADRFLRRLPGVLPAEKIPQDETLLPPRQLFAFSFYDAPNPDDFFGRLAAWLRDESFDESARPASYWQVRWLLAQTHGCLVVMDGLERLQSTGMRGSPFGQILDGRLRDLVLSVADGTLPGVRVLATTRFYLFDTMTDESPYYSPFAVEKLAPDSCLALLRQRGVKHGTDDDLRAIARDQGFHALSVDLAGGYIACFCGGDPSRLPPEPRDALDTEPDAALDPRIAAIREQEGRFARLAERYREALSQSEPATLALLQRVCLFRLGVAAETLTSIFMGEGKEEASGEPLARLDEKRLEAKLGLLVKMKLVERAERGTISLYTVHPAVRDGFLRSLDAETAQRGHDAARKGLEASLGGQPGDNPSDQKSLDLLEEIIYHTLAAGHLSEAWDIYWNRIGGYKNLGWRLGAYERGERICKAFIGLRLPERALLPDWLLEDRRGILDNEWALYLSELGRLEDAARCYKRVSTWAKEEESWKNACVANLNLVVVLVLAGRLTTALQAVGEALRCSNHAGREERCLVYAYRAHVSTLLGETAAAHEDFLSALQLKQREPWTDPRLYGLPGVWYGYHLANTGENQEATRVTEENDRICTEITGTRRHMWFWRCRLVLADLALVQSEFHRAKELVEAVHEWAIARDAKESLCWSSLILARIALAESDLQAARIALDIGLRIARECGFGIYHIDLLLVRAHIALHEGDVGAANDDLHVALFAGAQPLLESGRPVLFAATDTEFGYARGIAEGRHLLAKAKLLQAAQKLGAAEFTPARLNALSADVRKLIEEARKELATCRDLRRKIQDPKIVDTERIVAELDGGVLTGYPLTPPSVTEVTPNTKRLSMKPACVFVSYSHRDKSFKDELIKHLTILKRHSVIEIWHDRMISAGEEWKGEIDKNLEAADIVLLLISADFLASDYGYGVEMRRALERHEAREARVIPIILRQVDWTGAPFSRLQALPSDARAVADWPNQDAAFTDVARGIRKVVESVA